MNILDTFERDGLIAPLQVVSPQRADYYARKYTQFIDDNHARPDFSKWTYGKTELLLGWVVELACEPRLLDAVEALIGPDILLWNAFLPAKAPGTSGNFGWHQDATYWPVTPTERIVSAWVALCDVNQECGAMRMVRGSHRLGAVPHETTYDPKSMLRRGQRAQVDTTNASIVEINLEPGQASLHHTLTLHCSGPNESDRWRLGVGFNFAAGDVRPVAGHSDSAMLLRGAAVNSEFVLEEAPDADLSALALDRFAAAERRQASRYADVVDTS